MSARDSAAPRLGNPFSIYYLAVHSHEDAGQFTPFQGFGSRIVESQWLFSSAAVLPVDIRELYMSRDEIVHHRILGARMKVIPIQLDALPAFLKATYPLTCVLAEGETLEHAARMSRLTDRPIAVLPPFSDDAPHRVRRGERSPDQWDALRAWRERCIAEIVALASRIEPLVRPTAPEYADVLQRATTATHADYADLRFPGVNHFITQPNQATLLSLGFRPSHTEGIADDDDSHYPAAQLNAARAVQEIRQLAIARASILEQARTPDLILTAPAMLAHFYGRRHRRVGGRKDGAHGMQLALEMLATQRGYIVTGVSKQNLSQLDNIAFLGAMAVRRSEAAVYTGAIAVRAASDISPVLRLPAVVNTLRPVAHQLAGHARSRTRDGGKTLNRLAAKLSQSLDACVPQEFRDFLQDSSVRDVLNVSDAPLEWVTVHDTPMMLRKNCSRIPVTPGNMFLSNCLSVGTDVRLGLSDFSEVLILRSLTPRDPLRRLLVDACRRMLALAGLSNMNLRVVDIVTTDDYITALNSFSGALMIYDGHGVHGTSESPSKLAIGSAPFDPWESRYQARVPPIVMLSACDTHPFDASHASPVNALLAAGASTVIGATLPVNGQYAALFVARLLLRIAEYLPLALSSFGGVVGWSGVIAGLQRMNYVTEAMDALDRIATLRLSTADRQAIAVRANMHINSDRDTDWYQHFVADLAAATGAAEAQVRNELRACAWITDALKYVQFGSPHLVTVRSDW